MQKLFLLIIFFLPAFCIKGQSFTGAGGAVPGTSTSQTLFPVTVSGVGNINGTKGLAQVCVNINHSNTTELEILLKAPDGTVVPLSIQNGATNYTGTCFTASATTFIKSGVPPYSGSYLPEGYIGAVNNGQNANGVWNLVVQDRKTGSNAGSVLNFTLTFSNTPAPPAPGIPPCSGTINPGTTCSAAQDVCDFNGQCGSTGPTSASSVKDWAGSGLDNSGGGCFGIENNSFVKFVASATTASFSIWVPSRTSGGSYVNGGVQMVFFEGTCGSGPVIRHGCYPHLLPYSSSSIPLINVVSADGLVVGNSYYLMIDGFNGDNCSFTIAANTGVNILNITPANPTVCAGKSVNLTASGGNGIYSWSPATDLSTTTGTVVSASPTATTIYTVTSTTPAGCPLTKDVTVSVAPPPVITTQPVDSLKVCQSGSVTPLTVTANAGSGSITGYQWYFSVNNLSWFASPGATSSSFSPNSSNSPGTLYIRCEVTNSNGCSTASTTTVFIIKPPMSTPTASATAQPTCAAPTGTIVVTSPSGTTYEFSKGGGVFQTGGTFSNLAPGSYNITAKDISTGCISNATAVTINAIPTAPPTPVATVTQSPTCLVATGTIMVSSPIGANIEYSVGGAYQTSNIFSSLTNGTSYTITAKDASTGCVSPGFVVAVGTVPGAPATPTGTVSTQPNCTIATGTITITQPSGANIQYSIGSGPYQASGVFTLLIPETTYSITAKDISSGCVSAPFSLTTGSITVPAAPVVSSPVAYCQNSTAVSLLAIGSNLRWYTSASGGIGSTTVPTPSTAIGGNVDYYVSQTAGTCESPRAMITVSTAALPSLPVVTTPVTYCQNAVTSALTATGSSLLWYTASTGGTGSSTAPSPPSTTGGNTIYYVTQSNGSCESARAAITVKINPSPTAPAVTSPVAYCQNATASALTAPGTNLLWYSTATGGIGTVSAPTPITTVAGNTIYYVGQSVNGCEGPRAAITVSVNANVAAPVVTSPVVYCQNTAASVLTATGNNLLWYNAASGGTGAAVAPTPSTAAVGSKLYYVSQTTNGCESPRSTITVTVNSATVEPSVASPVTYCQNVTAVPLNATGSGLIWYTSNTGSGSSVAPTPSTSAAGNTFFYVTQTLNGCESPKRAITVTVNSESTAVTGFKFNPDIVCINGPDIGPAYDFGFTNGGTFSSTPAGLAINANTGDINMAASTPGSYLISYTFTSTGCIHGGTSAASITINPSVPTATIFSYSSPVCKDVLTVTPSTVAGFTSGGTFTSRPGLSIDRSTGAIDIANSLPGGYQVTYNITALGCRLATSNFSFINIVDTTSPIIDFSYSPNKVCINNLNNPALVKATSFTTGGTFSSAPAGLSINVSTGNVNMALSVPGVYTITYNVPALFCRIAATTTTTFTINAYASPETRFSYLTPVCKSDGTTMPAPVSGFATGGLYSSADVSIDPVTGIVDLKKTAAGNYLIRYDVSQGSCNPAGFSTAPLNILSQPLPPVIGPVPFICGPQSVTLSATAAGSIDWYDQSGLSIPLHTGSSFTSFLDKTKSFYLTNRIGTCTSQPAILNAIVTPAPIVPFLGNDTAICSVDKLVLDASGPFTTYLWQNGSVQPTLTVTTSGLYKVTVSTGAGCSISSSININVLDNCNDISFPTAFTPDGNGSNDKFGPLGNLFLIKRFALFVYNRFGELVYSSNNPYEKWDGTYRGKTAGMNNFVWVATYLFDNRTLKTQKGNLVLIK
jgi:gliding motility-associated-like protein